MGKKTPEIKVLTKENFFRPYENIHIQMSNEFPDYIGVLHSHEYIEVVYIVSGSAIHEIDGKKYSVKRGDLFVINMNTPHVFYNDSSSQEPFVAYDLMFTPEFFDESITGNKALESLNKSFMFYSLFNERKELPPFFSVSGSEYTMFGELFNKIYLEHRGCENGYIEIIRAYLLQLIITIFRLDKTTDKYSGNIRNKQIVNYITDYIKRNYNEHISISKLAQMVFLNPDYMGRVFKNATGMTISAMIQKTRVDKVCHFLSSTDRNISDIALSCGFEDVKFFYTVFKKHMGVLPGEYRKQTRNADV